MLFFLIALFALVSRWTVAYPLIVFSCLFYMLSRRLSKRRYIEAFTQVRMQHLFCKDGRGFSSYSPSESAENALHDRGLISGPPCIIGAKFHHVVHGTLSGLPVSIGEAAFVRRSAQHAIHSVAGTLITVSGLLPPEEKWVILRNNPFASFCAPGEYRSAAMRPSCPRQTPFPPTPPPGNAPLPLALFCLHVLIRWLPALPRRLPRSPLAMARSPCSSPALFMRPAMWIFQPPFLRRRSIAFNLRP